MPRLYAIAAEEGLLGPHLRLLEAVAEAYPAITGRRLAVNGAGAAGAALADLGLPPALARGFALLARTAGLIGHLAEEMDDHSAGASTRRWTLGRAPSLLARTWASGRAPRGPRPPARAPGRCRGRGRDR